jgi:hypothetical protein
MSATKAIWMQHDVGVLCHKIKGSALHAFVHGLKGGIVVGWLASDVTKSFTRKVHPKEKGYTIIVSTEVGIIQNSVTVLASEIHMLLSGMM